MRQMRSMTEVLLLGIRQSGGPAPICDQIVYPKLQISESGPVTTHPG